MNAVDVFPCSVAITGAGRGLGRALARAYAVPGRSLFLCGQNIARLEEVSSICADLGAKVACRVVDVRDRDAVAAWIEQIEQKMPLDLMIVNAGTFSGRTEAGAFESLAQGQTQIEVNLIGAMNTLYLAAERMKLRRQGRIALVSSLAAILPLADAPGYSASKAGLSAFGKALREDLKPHGVGVSVIHPGHIRTDQTIRHQGKVRLALSPEDAAGRIVRGLASNRAEIAFPIAASIWVHLVSMLPWRLRAWLNRSDRFTVSAPDTTT